MTAIDFVIRTRAGVVQNGSVAGEDQGFLIDAGAGNDISLNIRQSDLRGYDRAADDLLITLADGRVIVLEGYFAGAGPDANRLFLSADGILNEVSFVEGDQGALFAQYGPTETWGKWSPSDNLIFTNDPVVVADAPIYDDDEVSMLGAGLLGAPGVLGSIGAGAAVLGGAALLGSDGGDGDGGNGDGDGSDNGGGSGDPVWIGPTVDNPDGTIPVGGDDPREIPITGTANTGSVITVIIGDDTLTTVADDNRDWEVVFDGDNFPDDGEYPDIDVHVEDPNDTETDLDGPTVVIDTTPPDVAVSTGTVSVGDLFNADGYADGVVLTGTAEVGATVTITVAGVTQTVIIDDTGTWTVGWDTTVLGEGEYIEGVTITAEDSFGNVTTITDDIQIDTVGMVSLDNAPLTGDDVINVTEHEAGLVLSGSTQVGSTVVVVIGGVSIDATVDASGSWTVIFDADSLAEGTYDTSATITATDTAGNVTTITHDFSVDTETTLTINTSTVEVDGIINADEALDGTVITGTAEAGASVDVTVGVNISVTVTADADGNWSVNVPASEINGDADGNGTLEVTATSVDSSGNTATASGSVIVDLATSVSIDAAGGDGVINATEQAGVVTVTGMAEAGASVMVNVNGTDFTAVVAADGSWSVELAAGFLPTGTTSVDVTATATDAAGNSASASGSIDIDTEIDVTVDTAGVEGDGVVNAAEAADGVLLQGTSEPGASVEVMVAGTALSATADAAGMWEVTIPAAIVPSGETSLAVSATATDAAGNVATASGSIAIDTETNVTVETATVETDGVINAAEHADGVTLTGTAEVGASVEVTLGSVTHTATVAADGTWTADFSAAELPTGEETLDVTAVSTDAAGNTATATGTVDVDTLVRNFAFTSTPGGADGVVNAEEAAAGITLTGTTEEGGSVTLDMNGVSVTATVAADGSWTADFPASAIPTGETTAVLTATSTDPAGNTATITQNVQIDTDAGILTIDPEPMETDDIVNEVEASDGVIITGTSNPGEMVTVTMNGVSHVVQTDAAGNWTAPFAASEVAPGTYTADITATITDSAGNTLTRTDSVLVDTEVLNFGIDGTPIEGDNVINADEAMDGVTFAGTTEIGGTVDVIFDGVSHAATVDASGNWTVSFAASEIAEGEYSQVVTVNTTDIAGNTATATTTVGVDTLVNTLTMDDPVTADDTINAAEAEQGVTLTGQVEAGSSLTVTMGGVAHVATVDATGNWTVDIPPSAIPTGTYNADVVLEATDAAGNTRVLNETIAVDTDAPDAPAPASYTRDHTGLRGITLDTPDSDTDISIGHVVSDTQIDNVMFADFEIPALSETSYAFDSVVPDGSHLVVTGTDAAGNTSGTYMVVDDTQTSEVRMTDDLSTTLSQFQIETIDLQFAEDSQLEISEAQLLALSSNTDTLVVQGGVDDSVTITGAQLTGSQTEGGQTYNVFSLGSATLLIEDDITNVVI